MRFLSAGEDRHATTDGDRRPRSVTRRREKVPSAHPRQRDEGDSAFCEPDAWSFPVFDRFSTNRAVERAKIGTENARLALADQRQTVALEVRRAVLDELSARESLRAALAQLRAATQALDFTRQRYEAGASTLHEVTLSRADLVEARSSRVSAAYTLLWQKHVRDYYVGVLDPDQRRSITLPGRAALSALPWINSSLWTPVVYSRRSECTVPVHASAFESSLVRNH